MHVFSYVVLFLVQTLPVLSTGSENPDSLLAPRVTDFKLSLHRRLESSRIRRKRNILNSVDSDDYQMRVGSSDEVDLEYLSQYHLTFWIPVKHNYQNQVLIGTQDGYLLLFELAHKDDRIGRLIANSTQTEVASKAMAFTHLDDQWFAVLQSSGSSSWIRVYKRHGRELEKRQVINLEGEADFDMVTVKNVHYLAVVTFKTTPKQPGFSLYHWTKTQLDEIAVRQVYGARSVACWVLDGTMYFAVAQEMNEMGNYAVGSPIFMFNSKEESDLVFRQMISTYGPKKVLHFSISGNHYVIFIGKREAAIYWWANDQFLLFQTIKGTAYASDVATLDLENGEVVIVIALKEEALFLTLDDSGQYVVPYSAKFTGLNLLSLQFMFSGEAFYFLPIFATYRPHRFSKLTLRSYYVPSGSSLDTLRQCVKDMFEMLDQKQTEINGVHVELGRVWLKDQNQNITTDVIVTGKTSSIQMTIITEVFVLVDEKFPPESSLSEVEEGISTLMTSIDDVHLNMGQSVLKSLKQDIAGEKHFHSSLAIPSLNLDFASIDTIVNGVALSRINQFALRKHGSQSLEHLFNIDSAYADSITLKTLNSVDINDYLLLKGEQAVTGNLVFRDVFSKDLLVNSINSMSTDDFITVNMPQDIRDLKVISSFKAFKIDVHGELNRENLNTFYDKIIPKDGDEILNGKSIIRSTVVIDGSLVSALINGETYIDQLVSNAVTVSTSQSLEGPFTFTAPVYILKDLATSKLNSIDLDTLATLHTEQTIHGDLSFNSMDIKRDLIVDTVNGHKLRDAAVLHSVESQFVEGHATFTGSIRAHTVDMSEYVTLDGVDPSLLVQDIVRHEGGVVTLNSTEFDNIVVTHHLTAMEGVNGYYVSDLPDLAWMKSTPQEVETPVHVKKMSSENIVEVKVVNRLHLNTDFVHTYGDEPIVASKTFSQKTIIESNIEAIGGTMINGFDVMNLKNELDSLVDDGTIRGNKAIHNLEIKGDIEASVLNDLYISDLMSPEKLQTVKGQVQIPSSIALKENLQARNVSFHKFNSEDLKNYFSRPLFKTDLQGYISNKDVSNLIASGLTLDLESKLNGISFDKMVERIVTLNTDQRITSGKHFLEAVYFLKPFVAVKLNSQDLSNVLPNVVFNDLKEIISSKKNFIGTVQGTDMFANRVNGIDVTLLARDAFLKSKTNVVIPLLTFTRGLKAGSLIAASHLNGISFEDLIALNKDETLEAVFLTNTRVSNLWVTGELNDCNLSELERRTLLYRSVTNQRIPEDLKLENLKVVGNLYIKSPVNDIPLQNINEIVITVEGDQIISSDIVLGPNWRATNINMKDTVNGENLSFLINDAVKFSVLKDIGGEKNFYNLKTNVVDANNIVAVILEGVNIDNLYNKAVLKDTEQIIDGEKTFSSLKVDVATIEGSINGLRLPQDMVLVSTTEHISSPIILESEIVLASDFTVEGKINGVKLSSFVENRVTLTGDEHISSSLSFSKDINVKGDMNVDGTVNDIVLEMISRKRPSTPLDGRKVFTNLLHISNTVSFYDINGYDLDVLNRNVMRRNRDGYIEPEQVFSAITAGNLKIQLVNTIPLPELPREFSSRSGSFNKTWADFDDFSSLLVRKVFAKIQMFEDQVTRFGYFALFQEINIGPTTKILYGYRRKSSYGGLSHSLVAWTSRRQCSHMTLCCDQELSQWLRVEKSGKLVPEHDPSGGLFYPLNDPTSVMMDSDFVVWTNWTKSQPKWCDKTDGSMFLAHYSHSGYFENVLSISNAPLLSDIKTFREGHLYAVAGFYYDSIEDYYTSSIVYRFMGRKWREYQILPSYGALSLDITYFTYYGIRELLLAIGTGTSTYSSVYKWNEEEEKFGLLQHIPSKYVTSTLWVKEGFSQLLILANVEQWPRRGENCIGLVHGGEIKVYRYEGRLTWIQSISLQGVVSMITFTLKGDTFLVAASGQLQTIYVYEWKGYAGFSLIQSMFVGEVRHLSSYIMENDFYMTVAIESGSSKVLKVVVQGNNFQAVPYKRDPVYPEQQGDEATSDVKPGC